MIDLIQRRGAVASRARLHLRRWLSATMLSAVAVACTSTVEARMATRYRCTFHDGTMHLVQQNLSLHYPDTVANCQAVDLPSTPPTAPVHALPEPRERPRTIHLGAAWSERPAPAVDPRAEPTLLPLIREASTNQQLDWALVEAVVHVESRHKPSARSPKGALGLMQVIPATAARYGVHEAASLFDPRANLAVGTRYLKDLLMRFGGRTDLALAAYNAGEGAVMRHGNRIPPYPETIQYVQLVLQRLESNTASRILRDSH